MNLQFQAMYWIQHTHQVLPWLKTYPSCPIWWTLTMKTRVVPHKSEFNTLRTVTLIIRKVQWLRWRGHREPRNVLHSNHSPYLNHRVGGEDEHSTAWKWHDVGWDIQPGLNHRIQGAIMYIGRRPTIPMIVGATHFFNPSFLGCQAPENARKYWQCERFFCLGPPNTSWLDKHLHTQEKT